MNLLGIWRIKVKIQTNALIKSRKRCKIRSVKKYETEFSIRMKMKMFNLKMLRFIKYKRAFYAMKLN